MTTGYVKISGLTAAVSVATTDLVELDQAGSSKSGTVSQILLAASTVSTWNPTLSFGGGTTGITYGTQQGRYSTIGNRIFFDLNIVLTNKGSSTGQAVLTLPLATNASALRPVFSIYTDSMAVAATTEIEAFALANSTSILFYTYAAGASTNLSETSFTNTTELRISGNYES